MPNYVYNLVTAKGDEDEVREFDIFVQNFSFNKVIPLPEWIHRGSVGRHEDRIYGEFTGLNMATKLWGSKWDALEVKTERGGTLRFQTAWSEVPRVIGVLSRNFPGLTIGYRANCELFNTMNDVDYTFKNGMVIDYDDKLHQTLSEHDFIQRALFIYDWSAEECEDIVTVKNGKYEYVTAN